MKLKLIKKVDEADDVKSFFWEPETEIKFEPGQYFYYTLPKLNYPDDRGNTRHFTISSSPTEGNILRLTTKIQDDSSGYKKTLNELQIGDILEGEGPQGEFKIPNTKLQMPNIFVAGGIGITPFRSMLKYSIDKNLSTPMYLLYSNSDLDFVFKKELDEWGVNIEYINTSVSGRIDKLKILTFIKKYELENVHANAIKDCMFWISGPPSFVSGIEDVLESLKIDSDNIKTDKFIGY